MNIKKLLCATVLASAMCFAGCVCMDCEPPPVPRLDRAIATLSAVNEEGTAPVASDLRLNLSLEVSYVETSRAQTRDYADSGFDDEIALLSLTCDKPVRGFAPGKNILTTSADVFGIRFDTVSEDSITLGQWLELMNEARTTWLGGGYGSHGGEWSRAYDVTIAFIPEGTDAAAGDYTFTFSMEMEGGTRYETTFAPVTIAALP